MTQQPPPEAPKKKRRIPFATVVILVLAAFAGLTYYLGTPPVQPGVIPTIGPCPNAVKVIVNNTASNEAYHPPTLTLVVGVNNTVGWVDDDPGFELHVISVAVPIGGSQWSLNMSDTAGSNTECFSLSVPGTYSYEMYVPYVVQGIITLVGASQSSEG